MLKKHPVYHFKLSLYDIDRNLNKIDSSINELLNHIEKNYVSEDDAENSSHGKLNDDIYLNDFTNLFSKPNDRTFDFGDLIPKHEISPYIYSYPIYLLNEEVYRFMDLGYREAQGNLHPVQHFKKIKTHRFIRFAPLHFLKLRFFSIPKLRIQSDYYKKALRCKSKSLYYNIFLNIKNTTLHNLGDKRILLSRFLFQWCSGTVLNYYSFEYKLNEDLLYKYLGREIKTQQIVSRIDIDNLNKTREKISLLSFYFKMTNYLLEKKSTHSKYSYKDFFSGLKQHETVRSQFSSIPNFMLLGSLDIELNDDIGKKLKKKKGHAHNKEAIIEKFHSLKASADISDSQIIEEVIIWYAANLDGKEIDEGTIRYHLGLK